MKESNIQIVFENKSVCSSKLFDYFYGKCEIEDILRCFGVNTIADTRRPEMEKIIIKGATRFKKGFDVCREEMVDELRYIMKYR